MRLWLLVDHQQWWCYDCGRWRYWSMPHLVSLLYTFIVAYDSAMLRVSRAPFSLPHLQFTPHHRRPDIARNLSPVAQTPPHPCRWHVCLARSLLGTAPAPRPRRCLVQERSQAPARSTQRIEISIVTIAGEVKGLGEPTAPFGNDDCIKLDNMPFDTPEHHAHSSPPTPSITHPIDDVHCCMLAGAFPPQERLLLLEQLPSSVRG